MSIKALIIPVVYSIIGEEMKGIKSMYNPAENKIEQNFSKLGFLSANLPPRWYPPLRPSKTTPIKLPQVYIELPNVGINSLLTENSKAIVARPAISTSNKSIVNADKRGLNINTGYINFYKTIFISYYGASLSQIGVIFEIYYIVYKLRNNLLILYQDHYPFD